MPESENHKKDLLQMPDKPDTELRKLNENLREEIKRLKKALKGQKSESEKAKRQLLKETAGRKQVEELLHESRERFQTIADYTEDWESWTGPDGKLIWVNSTVERMTGYFPIECMKMPDYPLPIIAPEDRARMAKAFESALQQESGSNVKCHVQRKDGPVIWVDVSWQPLYSREKKWIGYLTSVRDITERELSEDALRRERDKAQRYLDIVGAIVIALDPNQSVTLINKKGCNVLGYTEKEIIGKNWFDHFIPDDIRDEVKGVYNKLMAGEIEPVEFFENPIITRNGSKRIILWHNVVLKDESDHVIGVLSSGADITERKKAEEEIKRYQEHLEELVRERTIELESANRQLQNEIIERSSMESRLRYSEQQHRIIFEKSPVGLVQFDVSGKIVHCNQKAVELFGAPYEEIIGFDTLKRGKNKKMRQAIMMALDGDMAVFEGEYTSVTGGRTRTLRIIYNPVNPGHSPSEVIATYEDITERVRAEEELKKAKVTAEEANKAKSDFLANMSHEMRTPMNAVLGYSRIMQRDPALSEEQCRNLSIINRSGEHLLALINDVLDLSKIEAGRVTLDRRTFNLHTFLKDIETMFRLRTDEKKLGFEVRIEEGVPQYIHTDENKLRQVMINLIGNAVKFTASGVIRVRVGVSEWIGEDVGLWCEIEDTGTGIRKQDFERIFEAFGQTSAGRELGGTGLGLTISREFIRMMGGYIIVVESELGRGSVFHFEIMAGKGAAEELEKKKLKQRVIGLAQGQGVIRILVAEDNPENRGVLEELLGLAGFEVKGVVNGKEAVEQWKVWHPHLIFMDIRMPEMDGIEATKRIKGTRKGEKTFIIALTAHAFEEEKEMFFREGCDDFIRKPFNEDDIYQMVARHLGVKYIYESPEKAEISPEESRAPKAGNLVVLPFQWAAEFRRRAIQGDIDSLVRLIREIEPDNKGMAQGLLKMVNDYRFEDIIHLFRDFDV